jgi:hypothetical protein
MSVAGMIFSLLFQRSRLSRPLFAAYGSKNSLHPGFWLKFSHKSYQLFFKVYFKKPVILIL